VPHTHTHPRYTESYIYAPGFGLPIGQIHSEQPTYQIGETIVIVIDTPTGLDNAQLWIYGGYYQNNYYVGSIPAGIYGFPIGAASMPGPETVVLAAYGRQISSTTFTVEDSTTTTAQYQTTTVTSYQPTQSFTTATTEYRTYTSFVQSHFDLTPLFALSAVIVILAILSIVFALGYFSLKKR
jgi:uncharacterized membrane protein